MKTYTQSEFDAIERDEYGFKNCPTGDYSQIQIFEERCSFGERCCFGRGCSFGERCSFGEWCSFGERCCFEGIGRHVGVYPFVAFIGGGSRIGSKTYLFNLEQGIYVRCGCFLGTLAEFRERVKETGADTMYLDIADLAERRLNEWRARS